MSKIQIICSSPGIRRNGIEHPASAVYDADHWSDTQLQAFRDDPAFIVQDVAEGGISLSDNDIDANIAAKVNVQVEKITQGLQASFQNAVTEKAADQLADLKADYDQQLLDLKAELTTAQTKVTELETENADLNKTLTASQSKVTELEAAAKAAPKK